MTDRFTAGQLHMRTRARRAAGEAAHRHEGHDGYSRGMDAAGIRQTQACVDAIGALEVEAGEVRPDPRAVAFADEAVAATGSGLMTDAEVQADMAREVTIPPVQPQQPGGEEALVEAVARALMDNRLGVGAFDRAARFFGHEVERDQWRNAAIAAIRVMLPDVRAQALEEAAQACGREIDAYRNAPAEQCRQAQRDAAAAERLGRHLEHTIRALIAAPPAGAAP